MSMCLFLFFQAGAVSEGPSGTSKEDESGSGSSQPPGDHTPPRRVNTALEKTENPAPGESHIPDAFTTLFFRNLRPTWNFLVNFLYRFESIHCFSSNQVFTHSYCDFFFLFLAFAWPPAWEHVPYALKELGPGKNGAFVLYAVRLEISSSFWPHGPCRTGSSHTPAVNEMRFEAVTLKLEADKFPFQSFFLQTCSIVSLKASSSSSSSCNSSHGLIISPFLGHPLQSTQSFHS